MKFLSTAAIFSGLFLTSCSEELKSANEKSMNFSIISAAFSEGQTIPQKYTCAGSDISPPLAWPQPPPGTKSIALICDDPDAPAGTWVHWLIYDLPPDTVALGENARTETLSNSVKQGVNDFKKIGYSGPCPPSGKPHRYFFKIYALNAKMNLPVGVTKEDLVAAMNNHVLAEGQLTGIFGR